MLTIGDTHAYQGDGELTGTGVGIDTTVTVKIERGPDFPNGGVVVETAENGLPPASPPTGRAP